MRDILTGLFVFVAVAVVGVLLLRNDGPRTPGAAAGKPTLLEFGATWCGPCKRMEPIIARLEADFRGRAEVVRVDIDQQPDLARQYGVKEVPTVVIVRNGATVYRVTGVTPYETLAAKLKS